LPTRKKHGKKSLMHYSNSHVITLDQYLAMLRKKALEKEIVDKIREQKTKKKKEKKYQDKLNIHLLKIQY